MVVDSHGRADFCTLNEAFAHCRKVGILYYIMHGISFQSTERFSQISKHFQVNWTSFSILILSGFYRTETIPLVIRENEDVDIMAYHSQSTDRVIITCFGPKNAQSTCHVFESRGGRLRIVGLVLVQLSESNVAHALFARDGACVELCDVIVFAVCSIGVALKSSELTCRFIIRYLFSPCFRNNF